MSLPKNAILCTIDIVNLYRNIHHEKGLISTRKPLDNIEHKKVTTDTLVEFADIVSKKNYCQFFVKSFRQKPSTVI